MIKAVLFDIDGTLLDTKEFIYQAYQHTLDKHGIKNISREYLESLGGKTLEEYYNILAPEIETELLRESHGKFQSDNLHLAVPFPKVQKVLETLKKQNLKIAGITSRGKRLLTKTLEIAGIEKYFDLIITVEDVKRAKPDPEGIFKVLRNFEISKDEAIMVGDSAVDMEAGINAGVKTVGVTYGFLGESIKNLQPDYLIDDLSELIRITSN